jgi:hypothetical protein
MYVYREPTACYMLDISLQRNSLYVIYSSFDKISESNMPHHFWVAKTNNKNIQTYK